jgi:adenylylsulfate kinase
MMTVWLTGPPCSGKSTLGLAVTTRLNAGGWRAELLDGDELRKELWPELGFTKRDRNENIRRFGFLAAMLCGQGIVPVVSAVSPYREARDQVRRNCVRFLEVFVDAPLATLERRDVKGMYKQARAGEIATFTGVSDPYEPPANPEVHCRTDLETIPESVTKIMQHIDAYFAELAKEQYSWTGKYPKPRNGGPC